MSTPMNAYDYALATVNNTARMINNMAQLPDGTLRDLPGELAAGVLVAQSNLAIASSLLLVAEILKETRP